MVTLVLSCSTLLASFSFAISGRKAANNILAFHSSAKFIGGFNAFRGLPLISCLPFKHMFFSMNNSGTYLDVILIFSANPPAPFYLLPINLSNLFFLQNQYLFNPVVRISDCFECTSCFKHGLFWRDINQDKD